MNCRHLFVLAALLAFGTVAIQAEDTKAPPPATEVRGFYPVQSLFHEALVWQHAECHKASNGLPYYTIPPGNQFQIELALVVPEDGWQLAIDSVSAKGRVEIRCTLTPPAKPVPKHCVLRARGEALISSKLCPAVVWCRIGRGDYELRAAGTFERKGSMGMADLQEPKDEWERTSARAPHKLAALRLAGPGKPAGAGASVVDSGLMVLKPDGSELGLFVFTGVSGPALIVDQFEVSREERRISVRTHTGDKPTPEQAKETEDIRKVFRDPTGMPGVGPLCAKLKPGKLGRGTWLVEAFHHDEKDLGSDHRDLASAFVISDQPPLMPVFKGGKPFINPAKRLLKKPGDKPAKSVAVAGVSPRAELQFAWQDQKDAPDPLLPQLELWAKPTGEYRGKLRIEVEEINVDEAAQVIEVRLRGHKLEKPQPDGGVGKLRFGPYTEQPYLIEVWWREGDGAHELDHTLFISPTPHANSADTARGSLPRPTIALGGLNTPTPDSRYGYITAQASVDAEGVASIKVDLGRRGDPASLALKGAKVDAKSGVIRLEYALVEQPKGKPPAGQERLVLTAALGKLNSGLYRVELFACGDAASRLETTFIVKALE